MKIRRLLPLAALAAAVVFSAGVASPASAARTPLGFAGSPFARGPAHRRARRAQSLGCRSAGRGDLAELGRVAITSLSTPAATFTHVHASWTQRPITCPATDAWAVFGTHNHVLILESSTGAGPGTRSVSLVDFTTRDTERPILTVLVGSAAVSSPGVQFSVGTGDAFFVFAPTGTTVAGLGIHRSDNGTILCPGPPPLTPTGQLFGEATATQLRIKMGGTALAACARPPGTSG